MVTSAGYARRIDLAATRPINVSKVALGPLPFAGGRSMVYCRSERGP